jgi:RND family efflux transporter MFP subunit
MEQTGRLTRQIGTLLEFGTSAGLTDGQLLERFMTRDGETAERAFTALVERHGPMVMRVCRGVLADPHDADDAFQATFLVLVRKARALWVHDSLGPWLHQVALRTSSHARAAALRRRRHEASAAAARPSDLMTEPQPDDLGPLLHEEIGRLPDRFRVPVVLCDLEGSSHEQAARHLGWPVGTVKSRLARARTRLRELLLRRGVAPAAVLAASYRQARAAELLPAELVATTSRAALRFAASRTFLEGPTMILAQGVLSAMSMTRWWKVACVLAAAVATVSGAGVLAGRGSAAAQAGAQAPAKSDGGMPVAPATQGTFRLVVADAGTLEASQTADLVSQVQGNTTIVRIVPEGKRVRKGDLVCELDSAGLRDLLTNQRITTLGAQASYQNAGLAREVAEIALKEYEEGIYAQDRATIQGEIELGKTAIGKAMDRLERIRRAQQKLKERMERHEATSTDIMVEVDLQDRVDSAEQTVRRETLSLGNVESKLKHLETYTRPKTVRELRSEIEKARSLELSKRQVWQTEQANLSSIEKQVAACSLVAPIDGVVVYANDPYRPGQQPRAQIEEGATVRDRQLIARIANIDAPMRINAKVLEAMVDRVEPGMRAKVKVDAFPGEVFTGVVTSVAPLPESRPFLDTHLKVYPTLIRLDNGTKLLRPGMTGKAEITVVEHQNVVTVPIDAILSYQGKDHVAVKKPDGSFEWRDVQIPDADPATGLAEVKEGLQPGEQVALKPAHLLSEFDRRRKGLGQPTKPARKWVDPAAPAPK